MKSNLDYEFLKKLNIIYIEDEDISRQLSTNSFEKDLNKVYVANNGIEGLQLFIKLNNENIRVDAIISDVNMPVLNGVELFKKIREINKDIPLIFISSKTQEEHLFAALKLNVYAYFKKPFELEKLYKKLQVACHKYNQQGTIKKQNQELQRYLAAINNVAIVSKTDLKGNITFVNDIFCKTSKYSEKELVGQSHNIIRHPDNPKGVYEELWKTIRNGDTWSGKLKNLGKDKKTYYVNSTIIPIFDDDFTDEIVEYVGIRFLTTEDELEKREFRKKVLKNIQDYKKREKEFQTRIDELESQKSVFGDSSDYILQKGNDELLEKLKKSRSQNSFYEEEIKKLKEKLEGFTFTANKKMKSTYSLISGLKVSNQKLEKSEEQLRKNKRELEKEIRILKEDIDEKNKKIVDLKDVISFYESRIKDLQSK